MFCPVGRDGTKFKAPVPPSRSGDHPAGVGVGAVVGVTVYLVLYRQTTIEGCVLTAGNVTKMTNEKDHQTYELVAGDITLRGGQKLRVKGKKGKRVAGVRSFRVKTIVADEGASGGPSAILLPAALTGSDPFGTPATPFAVAAELPVSPK